MPNAHTLNTSGLNANTLNANTLSASTLSGYRAETERHYHDAVERVILAMREHLDEPFALEDMARVAIMSPFHLNRVFRQLTGVPPCRFLTALRLEAAKRLLLTTDYSVTDVSLEVGYSSLGTFTRRFTELVGASPGRFRGLAETLAAETLGKLRGIQGNNVLRFERLEGGIRGQVAAPKDFRGPIFVGLFEHAVPQSQPLACALLTQEGPFRLSPVPDGEYYLVTVGLSWSQDPRNYLLYENALRAGSIGQPLRVETGKVQSRPRLELRPSKLVDPPILLTLPLLLSERLQQLPALPVPNQVPLQAAAVAVS